MPINVGSPGIDDTNLTSPLDALPNIRWAGEQARPTQIYDDFWKQQSGYHAPSSYDVLSQEMGPNRPGSINYGATMEQQQQLADPRNFTLAQAEAPPITLLQQAIKPTDVAGKIKGGQLSLDMIHPLDLPSQFTGSFINQATPAVGDSGWLADPGRFLAERNIQPLGNLPTRLLDYALTPLNVLVNHLANGGIPPAMDASGMVKYAFQKDGRYWQWVADPGVTDEQLQQQAWAAAQGVAPGYQNQDYQKAIYDQFQRDRKIMLGLSSGDDAVDSTAMMNVQQYAQIAKDHGMTLNDVIAAAANPRIGMVNAVFNHGQGGSSLYTDIGMAQTPLLSGNGFAGIPIFGDLWRQFVGPSDDTKKLWASLTVPQRQQLLATAASVNGSAFIIATLPVFSAVGDVAAFGAKAAQAADYGRAVSMGARAAGYTQQFGDVVVNEAGALSGIGAGAAQTARAGIDIGIGGTRAAGYAYDAYSGGLHLAATAMKVGFGTALANWTAEAFVPGYTDFLGREIDQSQPVSHSPFAGAVNTFGYFVSPTEVIGPYLGLATKPIKGVLSNITSGITSEIPIDRFGLGGQEFRVSMNKRLTSVESGEQMNPALLDDSAKGLVLSQTMNTIRSTIVRGWQAAIHSVEPTGWTTFDNLPLQGKIDFATQHLLALERELPAVIDNRLRISTLARKPLGFLATTADRDLRNAAQAFSRGWEDDVARDYVTQYGSGFFSSRANGPYGIPALQQFIEDTATRMGYSADMAGIAKDVGGLTARFGDRLAAWESYARAMHQVEFHANNATLQEVARVPMADGTISSEADKLNMVRQNHLFTDLATDFSEQLKAYAKADDPAAAEAAVRDRAWSLIQSTEELQGWWAGQKLVDRTTGAALPKTRETIPLTELDRWLDDALPLLMHRRALPPLESSSAGEPINAFHRQLDSQGQWTLAFKPEYATEAGDAFGNGTPSDVRPTFVSFHRMGDGSFMQSPYIEYPMSSAGQIELGGQGYLASRMDSLTRAWRSWRIGEFQRGLLHRNLSRYEGVTAKGMDKFFNDVNDLARQETFGTSFAKVRMTPQGVGAMGTGMKSLGEKIQRIAEETFGKGPYRNLETGALENVDWNKVLQNSFRQSHRLNLTAGIVGKLKTAPHGIGDTAILASDFAVPLLRFGLSPVFRVSEYIESAMANAGRATFDLDPITAPLFERSPLQRQHGVTSGELTADPMAQALDTGGTNPARGRDLQFLSRGMPPEEQLAREQAAAGQWQGVDVPGGENAPPPLPSYQRLAEARRELDQAEYAMANIGPDDLTAGLFDDLYDVARLHELAGTVAKGPAGQGFYDYSVSRTVGADEYEQVASQMEAATDRWMAAREEYEAALAGTPGGKVELAKQNLASTQATVKLHTKTLTQAIDIYTSDMEWSRDRLAAAMGELPEFAPETPGFIRMYHGSPASFHAFDDARSEPSSLVGPGIYTTDSRKLARSYTEASRETGLREDPIVYGVDIPADVPIVDLEKEVPPEVKAHADQQVAELAEAMTAGFPDQIVNRNGATLSRTDLRALAEGGFQGEVVNAAVDYVKQLGRERQAAAKARPFGPSPPEGVMSVDEAQAWLDSVTQMADDAGLWTTIQRNYENPTSVRDPDDMHPDGMGLTGMEMYRAVRARSGFGARFIGDDMTELRSMWEGMGYGALRHQGGVLVGNEPHNVIVALRAENARIVERNYPDKIDEALDREREVAMLQDGIAETTGKVDDLRQRLGDRQLELQPHIDRATRAVSDAQAESVQEAKDWLATRPASSYGEIPGQPEAAEAAIDKAGAGLKGRAKELWDKVWTPQSYKEEASHILAVKVMRDTVPLVLKASGSRVVELLQGLGIPERNWAEFLIADRTKYQAWQDTGTQAAWEDMQATLEKARGAAPETAAELDAFTQSDEWSVIADLFRLNAKAAQAEAFGVHFFAGYRSTVARSLNHPLLGFYPAAWAYKAAKEWYRFLYDNRMFGSGALHLGMTPAVAIAKINDAQDQGLQTFPQADLLKMLGEGPLGSTFFIANLLLPGDWSSLPFPLSRTLRLAMRGDYNPADHIAQNIWGGTGGQSGSGLGVIRDMRLMTESGNEFLKLLTQPQTPDATKFNKIALTEANGGLPLAPADFNKIVSYSP